MKKTLIIGMATLAIAGSALIGSGLYAASTGTTSTTTKTHKMWMRSPTDLVNALSGKVSPEALMALQTLMTKHQTAIEAMKSSTTNPDKATLEAQHTAFKTEMDALIVKYPELKTALPQWGKMGRRGPRGGGEMESIFSTLPSDAQTSIQTIHDSYKTKYEALRAEENTQVEAIIAKYPDVKAKYDTAKANRPTQGGRGEREMDDDGQKATVTSTTTATN